MRTASVVSFKKYSALIIIFIVYYTITAEIAGCYMTSFASVQR